MPDGFKEFSVGETLTAADVNGYLMEQAVTVFTNATARDAAIAAPAEGQLSYLTGSNTLTFYNGSAWADLSTIIDLSNAANNALADLADVAATSPTTNQGLVWNGSAWAPATIDADLVAIDHDHTDTAITMSTSYQTLQTFTIPAGEPAAGDTYRATFFGDWAHTTGLSKTWTFRLLVGTTTVTETNVVVPTSAEADGWRLDALVAIVSTSSQRCIADLSFGPSASGEDRGDTEYGTAAESTATSTNVQLQVKTSATGTTQTVTYRAGFLERILSS